MNTMSSSFHILASTLLCLLFILLIRILWVARQIIHVRKTRKSSIFSSTATSSSAPLKTMIVLGSGGHTTEMLSMIRPLPPKHYYPLIFVKAETDTTSAVRLQAQYSSKTTETTNNKKSLCLHNIPRSREVGQSYWSSIFTTLGAMMYCIQLVWKEQPQLLLCNGPGTCLPLAIVVWMTRIMNVTPTQVVFCESFCRVQTLSLTGKFFYYGLADLFIVHWPELQNQYPSSVLSTQFVATASTKQDAKQLQQQDCSSSNSKKEK